MEDYLLRHMAWIIREKVSEGTSFADDNKAGSQRLFGGQGVQYHAFLPSRITDVKKTASLGVTQPQSHRRSSNRWVLKRQRKSALWFAVTGGVCVCESFELHVCVHVQLWVKLGIRAGKRGECLHSVWVSTQCAASLSVSLWDCYKRISDVDAESEGEAERTKRMLYHCGVQSQWVFFFYANCLHYSKHTDVHTLHTCSQGKVWLTELEWERKKRNL